MRQFNKIEFLENNYKSPKQIDCLKIKTQISYPNNLCIY